MVMQIYNDANASSLLRQAACEPTLYQAWRKVRANRGAAGIDAISLQLFERDLRSNLSELARNLLNKSYEPMPARYVNVPKPNGKERELAIPTVRDRVAQRVVLDLIEPLFEPQFLDCSFAFRPGRSAEMAIQRFVVARAQGFRWIAGADIQDFFPSINHEILIGEITRTMDDADILDLIKQWLYAGVLDGARPTPRWISRWRSHLAGVNLAVRDGLSSLLDEFLTERLGITHDRSFADSAGIDGGGIGADTFYAPSPLTEKHHLGRVALRRLVQDGLLLALAERAALGGVAARLLGLGGAALTVATVAPILIRKLGTRSGDGEAAGAQQGAPISPLLSNIYLHPFDVELTARRLRLLRYCDDFVILSRTEAEAREALRLAEASLAKRSLRLNPDKTRVLAPGSPLQFLGYDFTADGRVIPPPTLPEMVARRVAEFAQRHIRRTGSEFKL
jgi:RNA-directed DNA polymerase